MFSVPPRHLLCLSLRLQVFSVQSFTGIHFTHRRLLRDFIECAPSSSVEDAVDTLSATGAALLKMVHTHEGATVVGA